MQTLLGLSRTRLESRRLLKAAADSLRPPGDPVDGRKMTDSHYINRLVDWIVKRESSETAAALITADLEYLGRRLDAVDEAGHKGAHAEVDRFDASRFLVATYLVLGDVLRLDEVAPQAFGAPNIGDSVEVANDFLVVTDHRVAEVSSQDEV